MADVNITIGARDDGSLGATLQQLKSQVDPYRNVASGVMTPPPQGLGGPPPVPGPLTQAAMAQVAARKALQEQNEKTIETEIELEQVTERASGSFERMAERMAMRLVLLEAMRLAFEGIKNTIEAASQKQFDVVQFKNVATAVGNINAELAKTQRIAQATAQSFDEVSKQRLKMYEAGVGFEAQTQAVQIAGELGRVWGEDAEKLSEMEAHIYSGTASEGELYHMATLLGGKFREQADAYRDMVTQAPLIERAMERQKTLLDRELEDQQRLGNVRTSFYEQHGIAEAAFKDKYRQVDPSYWNKDEALAHAAYGAREGLQKKFAEGQAQMQEELGLSDASMTELINSGVVGSKDLLEASRRTEEERKRNTDRAFQDQKSAIELGKDEAKLNLMQLERDALFDQVKAQKTLNDLTEKYNAEQQTTVGQGQKLGSEIKRTQEDSGTLAQNTAKSTANLTSQLDKYVPIADRFKGLQPWERPKEPTGPGPTDTANWLDKRMEQLRAKSESAQPGTQPQAEEDKPVPVLNEILTFLKLVLSIP